MCIVKIGFLTAMTLKSSLHDFIVDLDVCKNKWHNKSYKLGEIVKRRHKCKYDLKIICSIQPNEESSFLNVSIVA